MLYIIQQSLISTTTKPLFKVFMTIWLKKSSVKSRWHQQTCQMVKYKTYQVSKTKDSQTNNIEVYRAFSSSLVYAIISYNHLPFVHFCPYFQILCLFYYSFTLFCSFFWKIACMTLLSKIDPGIYKNIGNQFINEAINQWIHLLL